MRARNVLKLIYVVIDGMGDLPVRELDNLTPLEAADTPNLDFLARKGKTGLMYTVEKGLAPESDVAAISILGYDPFKYSTGRGILEAVGAGVNVKDGDLALRCNFATLASNRKIVDRRAGRNLTTEEAAQLSQAVNDQVSLRSHPAEFTLKNTIGYRAVLVIKGNSLSSRITNTDSAYSKTDGLGVAKTNVTQALRKCRPEDKTEEAKMSAELVNEFIEKSHNVLARHSVNKKRRAEGKPEANLIITRDAGHLLPKFYNIAEKYNVKFVSLTDMPVEIGISKLAGMSIAELPPPSNDLCEDCILRVNKLIRLLPSYDCFYVHIKGPDEPGHDGDCYLKKSLLATIDKHFFGMLITKIELEDFVICVTADHSTPCKLKVHTDDPVPLLITGSATKGDNIRKFSERNCRKGSLGILAHGTELMPKLMGFLKGKKA